jgi:hypothetical protein
MRPGLLDPSHLAREHDDRHEGHRQPGRITVHGLPESRHAGERGNEKEQRLATGERAGHGSRS